MPYPLLMNYILGFDGGGTKTECVLMDSADHIVARTFAGPSNPFRIGVEAAVRAVDEAAQLALREASLERNLIAAVGAALAGTANPEMRQRTLVALQMIFPGIPVRLLTDLEAALAAVGGGPAIVLVAGTGSAAIGRNAGNEVFRAGGYGPFASDQGSAFDVGRRAVACAAKAGSETVASSLGAQILLQLNCATWAEVQRRAEAAPDEVFPPIFPVVAAAADAGDPAAREILLSAVNELMSLVTEVANQLGLSDTTFTLAKTGGMIGRSAFLDAALDTSLRNRFVHTQFAGLKISPAEAAALAAKS